MVSGWCWVCNIKLPFKTKSVGICQGERRIRAELGGEERLVEGNCGDYYCFLFYSTTWVSIEVVNNEHENYRQISYNENMQDWLSNLFNIQSRMQFKENQPCSNKFYDTRSWAWDGVHRSLKRLKCHIFSVAMRNLIFCSYGIMQFGYKI